MTKFISQILLSFVVFAFCTNLQAQITITDSDINAGETVNWTKDNEYLLDGFVFVEDGATLNIEAGTIIKGKAAPSTGDLTSALVIAMGGKINATGTADEPIIFTAESDNGALSYDDRGLWGGLLLLGRATIARDVETDQIEGIPASETRARYGGTDDSDNSGTLEYVSIRHGGAALTDGNEINGLTLGGVGNGTTIHHIEVFSNLDDGIEWFGGTVDCKYLAVSYCGDDCMDYDYGWRGKGQHWFALIGADKGDNAGEHDGAKPDSETPFSKPTIYNATYIGSGQDGDAKNSTCLHFRDAAGGTYANSIFIGFKNHAIEVEDLGATQGLDSRQRMEDGDLVLKNNIWFDFGSGTDLDAGDSGIIRVTTDEDDSNTIVAEDPTAQFLIDHLSNNANSLEDPQLGGISREDDGGLDPRPNEDSPVYTNEKATASDSFFDETDHIGAFGSTLWLNGWTALSEGGYLGELATDIASVEENGIRLEECYPNPTNNTTNINFTLPTHTAISLKVYDITGKELAQLLQNQKYPQGTHSLNIDCSAWQAGMYLYTLQAGNTTLTQKLLIK